MLIYKCWYAIIHKIWISSENLRLLLLNYVLKNKYFDIERIYTITYRKLDIFAYLYILHWNTIHFDIYWVSVMVMAELKRTFTYVIPHVFMSDLRFGFWFSNLRLDLWLLIPHACFTFWIFLLFADVKRGEKITYNWIWF